MNVTVQVGKVATQAQGFLTQSKAIDINENKFRQFTRLNIQKNEDWPIMFKKMTFTSQGEENVRADYTADGLKIIGHNDPNAWSPVFNFGLIIFIFTIGLISIRVTMNYHRDRLHLSSREELLAELSELHRKKESGMISTSQYQAHYQQVYSSLLDIACRQERNE
jgi:hypothetical protein